MPTRIHALLFASLLATTAVLASPTSRAADIYDTAVQHAGCSADAGTLHRIDEACTVKDFEKRGFELVGKSDLLRRPAARQSPVTRSDAPGGARERAPC